MPAWGKEPLSPPSLPLTDKVQVLRINLADQAGKDLGNLLLSASGQTQLANQASFRAFFKGLALSPAGSGNNAIMGFSYDPTVKYSGLELYYTNNAGEKKSHKFYIDELVPRFHRIQPDFSTRPDLAGLAYATPVPASATGNRTYLQSGSGLRTLIEIPGLDKLRARLGTKGVPANIAINKAELVFPVAHGTNTTKGFVNPEQLRLARAAFKDNKYRVATDASGNDLVVNNEESNFTQGYVMWGPLNNKKYQDSTQYRTTITNFVQQVIIGRQDNSGMLLYPAGIKVQTNRAILQGDAIKLRLYYTEIK